MTTERKQSVKTFLAIAKQAYDWENNIALLHDHNLHIVSGDGRVREISFFDEKDVYWIEQCSWIELVEDGDRYKTNSTQYRYVDYR